MREWQQTKFKDLVLPDAVYYQSIWAVRDLYRMENQLLTMEQNIRVGDIPSTSIVSDGRNEYAVSKQTEDKEVRKA